jgi:hypothetical protein
MAHPNDSFCFAHTVSVNQVPKSGGAVDVVWKYVANQFGVVDDGEGDQQTAETGIMSMSVGSNLVSEWRENITLPEHGLLSGSMMGVEDIEGDTIDTRGTGATRAHVVIPISVTIETPWFPNVPEIRGLVNKRNSTYYLGCDTGNLLYKGTSSMSRNKQGIWTTTHQFLWDELLHLRQFPERDFDNRIKIGEAEDGDYEGKAFKVLWFQPFKELGSFGSLGLDVQL